MKKIILIGVLFTFTNVFYTQTQDSIRSIISQCVSLAKEQSLYSEEINWDSIKYIINAQVDTISTIEEIGIPLTTLINGMRDHHAKFRYNNEWIAFFTDSQHTRKTDARNIDDDIWHIVNYETRHEFELLNDSIGYVKIAGIGPCDIYEESKKMRNNFDSIANLGARKWIVDLRYNAGGNMYPMLECLAPLFSDGIVGFDANLKNEMMLNWEIRAGNFYYGDYLAAELPNSSLDFSDAQVVVLTSRYTTSSGEVVTTTFKGRENTTSIGEPTGGYTTVTNWEHILDNLTMSISISYYTDRNGVIYHNNISPDVFLKFVPETDKSKDEGISRALDLLIK